MRPMCSVAWLGVQVGVCVSVASPIVLFLFVVGGKNCNVVVQQLPSSLR